MTRGDDIETLRDSQRHIIDRTRADRHICVSSGGHCSSLPWCRGGRAGGQPAPSRAAAGPGPFLSFRASARPFQPPCGREPPGPRTH